MICAKDHVLLARIEVDRLISKTKETLSNLERIKSEIGILALMLEDAKDAGEDQEK